MRRTALAAVAVAVSLVGSAPAGARAAAVLELGRHGRVHRVNDRFLPRASSPLGEPGVSGARAVTPARRTRPREVTVVSTLASLAKAGAITGAEHRRYLDQWRSALRVERRLSGTRAAELTAVTENLHAIAAEGAMTAARLPALFLTLERNVQWWSQGTLLSYGQRVEFSGSQLVWEYYPGQGIELQPLASFGKADGMYTAGRADYGAMKQLVGELLPLGVPRAGGLAWEYYFSFDGGRPPWTSAMTEGTALEALTRAYRATHDPMYLHVGESVLGTLRAPPPGGVSVPTPVGRRFLQYSFAPSIDIINAFLQTLIGLFDFARASHDPLAKTLFGAGDAQARAELPSFNTGAWSLYQPGLEDSLSYHELVTGFLHELCARTHASIYCTTASEFDADLKTPPALTQLTTRARAQTPFALRFRLSKISHVGIVVLRGAQTVVATSAEFPYGVQAFALPKLRAGTYTVHLAATDLAGNFNRLVGQLVVVPPRHASRRMRQTRSG